jgi:hypothetical protein
MSEEEMDFRDCFKDAVANAVKQFRRNRTQTDASDQASRLVEQKPQDGSSKTSAFAISYVCGRLFIARESGPWQKIEGGGLDFWRHVITMVVGQVYYAHLPVTKDTSPRAQGFRALRRAADTLLMGAPQDVSFLFGVATPDTRLNSILHFSIEPTPSALGAFESPLSRRQSWKITHDNKALNEMLGDYGNLKFLDSGFRN